jgi:hypothetical protein
MVLRGCSDLSAVAAETKPHKQSAAAEFKKRKSAVDKELPTIIKTTIGPTLFLILILQSLLKVMTSTFFLFINSAKVVHYHANRWLHFNSQRFVFKKLL